MTNMTKTKEMSEGTVLLVAPTEPAALKRVGVSSSLPETYGVDVMWSSPVMGLCGVQRKEFRDLLASMEDGRLGKEVIQMEQLPGVKVLVIEGEGVWGNDGALLDSYAGKRVRKDGLRGYLYTLRSAGVWVETSGDLTDTIAVVQGLVRWSGRETHHALLARPGPTGDVKWGKIGRREWAIHLLSGFEGVGHKTAASIIDHFGKVPLQWEVDERMLQKVPGVGKVRARQLIEALEELEEVGDE